MQRSTFSLGASTFTPKAPSTSALPDWLETERLPCLATLHPGARQNESRGRRDVERALLIAARAAGVENGPGADVYSVRLFAHHARRAGDLVDRLTFHTESGQKSRHLQRRRLAGHDLVHDLDRFRFGEIDAIDELIDGLANFHADFGSSAAGGKSFRIVFLGPQQLGHLVGFIA